MIQERGREGVRNGTRDRKRESYRIERDVESKRKYMRNNEKDENVGKRGKGGEGKNSYMPHLG